MLQIEQLQAAVQEGAKREQAQAAEIAHLCEQLQAS
eukprot:COSAG05_NODE_15912_length_358_cov_0.783784_2_plen_35_part_01